MSFVSIVMPYFKKDQFINETIYSIINQTYKDFEIIIIDDEVNENSRKVLFNLKKLDKRINIISNENNIGVGLSRNKGIRFAKGEYIAFCDCDDIWVNTKLEYQLNFMKNHKVNFSFTAYDIINKDGKIISHRKADHEMTFKKLIRSCDIGLSTVILKKDLLNDKDINFPNIKTKEDFVLWLKLAKNKNKMFGINERLTKWRKLNNSLSSSTFQKILDGYKVYRVYMKFGIINSFLKLFILALNYLIKK